MTLTAAMPQYAREFRHDPLPGYAYRVFRRLRSIWSALGYPCEPLVRYIRHNVFGKKWPVAPLEPVYTDVPWLPKSSEQIDVASKSVLAVIPTSGSDIAQLRRCVDALEHAASGTQLYTLIVICPDSGPNVDTVKEQLSGRATTETLPAPFNYPRSINTAFEYMDHSDAVLFLNDDCEFLEQGDLAKLMQTLLSKKLACTGPWVSTKRENERNDWQFSYVQSPLMGCCVLWDKTWLERIGKLDEQFGEGYGCDESDQTLRARRRGALFGQEQRVTVFHERHGTFGKGIVHSALHRENIKRWQKKYPGVHCWGESKHWMPLPGLCIAVEGVSEEEKRNMFTTMQNTLDGFRWSLEYNEQHPVRCIVQGGTHIDSTTFQEAFVQFVDEGMERLEGGEWKLEWNRARTRKQD